jgi:hypothetical protein
MSNESRGDRLTRLTAAYLDHLEAGAAPPALSDDLSPEERADAEGHLRLLRALWGSNADEPPPLADDPVATRFGFNRVTPTMRVSGRKLRELRQLSRYQTSELAEALAAMGHEIERRELGTIERSTSHVIPMSLASGLAALLDVAVADFEAPPSSPSGLLGADDFIAHPLFLETVRAWAEPRGLDAGGAATRARRQLLLAQHRGGRELPAEEWQAVLRDLLEADGR